MRSSTIKATYLASLPTAERLDETAYQHFRQQLLAKWLNSLAMFRAEAGWRCLHCNALLGVDEAIRHLRVVRPGWFLRDEVER